MTHISSQQNGSGDSGSSSVQRLGDATNCSKSDILDNKLDLILRKMRDLDEKNGQLEMKIDQQDPIMLSSTFSHGSLVRGDKSSKKVGCKRVKCVTLQDIST